MADMSALASEATATPAGLLGELAQLSSVTSRQVDWAGIPGAP